MGCNCNSAGACTCASSGTCKCEQNCGCTNCPVSFGLPHLLSVFILISNRRAIN
ncbi:hypothetical protein F4805DRAFT_410523 [Annulohypoxylon moriforme]|nr:hypothetical protein F4805DRAFT_410523 [Annulohypoxylon moriforme]